MAAPITVYPLANAVVLRAGMSAVAAYGPIMGGLLMNPREASDQGLGTAEVLFVDPTGPAALLETATTVPVQPGGVYRFLPGQATNVWINSVSANHKLSGYVLQAPTPFPPVPQVGTFPPAGPVTLASLIPSYLYEEYADDDDLQAFVSAYNEIARGYVDWFASGVLPVYTSDQIVGGLLDWVAQGLYGMKRPALSSGRNRDLGPYNTFAFNTLPFNVRRRVGPQNVTVTSDDVFKRIMTWNFYKGDGNEFSIPWLKRRIKRFLIGTNGSAPNVDQTYEVSVTFGPGIISIRLSFGARTVIGGALFNKGFGFNRRAFNSLSTQFQGGPSPLAFAGVLKQAFDSGALIVPFQYEFVVTTSGG